MHLVEEESVETGIRRILVEETEKLLASLHRVPEEPAKSVHEARKAGKRVRAVLRLIRPCAETLYKQENAVFREIGRSLSMYRDAEVKVRSLDDLVSGIPDGAPRYTPIREQLATAAVHPPQELTDRVQGAVGLVSGALDRLREVQFPGGAGFALIRQGLHTAYKEGRCAMKCAVEHQTEVAFHDWRKRVKDLAFQVDILHPIWPAMMKRLRKELEKLGEALGREHDFAVLQAELEPLVRAAGLPDDAMAELNAELQARRSRCQAAACKLGRHIYAEKPRRFTKRMETYWKAWQA